MSSKVYTPFYYYKTEKFSTNKRWKNPDISLMKEWWLELNKRSKYTKEYLFYIVGGVLQNVTTFDIDIIMIGEENYEKIQDILDNSKYISIEKEQLVDLKYSNILFEVSEDNLYMPDHFVIRNFNESYIIDSIHEHRHKWSGKEIYPGLWKTEVSGTSEVWEWTKHQYRHKNYKGKNNMKLEDYLYMYEK